MKNSINFEKSKTIKIVLLFLFFILLFMTISNADTELKDLEINIEVRDNGSMHVEEKWNVYASEISTLFKTFKKNDSYSSIENVKIRETTAGKENVLVNSGEYKYHQDEGYFHALVSPEGEFEIAWGADMDGERRSFVVEYDVYNVVTTYNDCEDFYWKIVGEDFTAPIDHLHGTVTIPKGVNNLDDFRIWAHGTLNGTITKESTNKLTYTVDDNKAKSFVEIRVVTPVGIFAENSKRVNSNKLDSILAEEQKNAEEANLKREQLAKMQKFQELGGNVFGGFVGILMLMSFKKRREFLETHPKIEPEVKYDYYRDIPDKMLSGFDACEIAEITGPVSEKMSSLMMSLALKKYISFDIQSKNKKDMYIVLEPGEKKAELNTHERLLLDYLKSISTVDKFSLKDFERYGQRHISKVDRLLDKMDETAKDHLKSNGYIDKERKEKSDSSMAIVTLVCMLLVFAMGTMLAFKSLIGVGITIVIGLIWFIDTISFIKKVGKHTQKGADEKCKWRGLKKFMNEFSMLDQREVPELALWEEYLVYATAFGIADKVIKQLKVVYPELNDTNYIANNYTVLNMASNDSFGKSFASSLSSSIGSVTNMSSGSGGGGGFSSGGGRRRRPEVAAVAVKL